MLKIYTRDYKGIQGLISIRFICSPGWLKDALGALGRSRGPLWRRAGGTVPGAARANQHGWRVQFGGSVTNQLLVVPLTVQLLDWRVFFHLLKKCIELKISLPLPRTIDCASSGVPKFQSSKDVCGQISRTDWSYWWSTTFNIAAAPVISWLLVETTPCCKRVVAVEFLLNNFCAQNFFASVLWIVVGYWLLLLLLLVIMASIRSIGHNWPR